MAAIQFTFRNNDLSFPSDLLPSDKNNALTFVAAVAYHLDHAFSGCFELRALCSAILLAAGDNQHVVTVSCFPRLSLVSLS
jgi:hypothetical protein